MIVATNLTMPASCDECPLDPSACTLWQKMPVYMGKWHERYDNCYPRRHEDCPLKPVKAVITDDDIRLEIRELDV